MLTRLRKFCVAASVALLCAVYATNAYPQADESRAVVTAAINGAITANGVGAITGPVLNNVLLQIVNSTVFGQTDLGSGVLTALGLPTNSSSGFVIQNGAITTGHCLTWGPGVKDSGAVGCASVSFPQTVSGTTTSGGIPYFSSTTTLASSPLLTLNALVIGGGAGGAPTTTTTGAGVLTALGLAPNASGGFATTDGSIVTGDCLIWGPGVADSGNSSCGGGTTTYSTHAALISATTSAPSSTDTIAQMGYATPGIGAASYTWSPNSYCGLGTHATPVVADGNVCILPSTQLATTAGRYLLNVGESLDVRTIGMAPGSQDNAPYIQSLMLAVTPTAGANVFSGGPKVYFAPVLGQPYTGYYFSQSLVLSRGMQIFCGGGNTAYDSVNLIFAAGIDGIVQEDGAYTSDGGAGNGSVTGCGVYSQGENRGATATPNSNVLTNATLFTADESFQAPDATWGNGDGLIVTAQQSTASGLSIVPAAAVPLVSPGAYVGTVTGGNHLTLGGSYVVNPQFAAAHAEFTGTIVGTNFTAGDVIVVGNSTYTFVGAIGSTPGNVLLGSTYLISAQNLANCINLNTTTSSCVAQTSGPNVTMETPYSYILEFFAAAGGSGGNSLTSTYTAAGTSAGTFGGAAFAGGGINFAAVIWQLPLSQAFTVQTTAGSGTVLVTASASGRFLVPGELIWNAAFSFGTTIYSVQGAALFTQSGSNNFVAGDTITISDPLYTTTKYTFVSAIANPGDVLLGANYGVSITNLSAAVNRGAGAGTTYVTPTQAQNTFMCADGASCTYGSSTASTFEVQGVERGPFNGTQIAVTYTPIGTPAGSFDKTHLTDQIVVMDGTFYVGGGQNATATEVNGTLWTIPAGLRRDVTAQSSNLAFQFWPIDKQMSCEGAYLNNTNCTGSNDQGNIYEQSGFGIWNSGNNYSSSQEIAGAAAKNYFADDADLGSLGITYLNFTSHSGESGTAFTNVLKSCFTQNTSYFVGGYFGGISYPACAATAGGTGGLWPATSTTGPLVIAPANLTPAGSPVIGIGVLSGQWIVTSGWNRQNCFAAGGPNSPNTYIWGWGLNACGTSTIIWNVYPNTAIGGNTFDLGIGIGNPIPVERFYNLSGTTGIEFPQGVWAGGTSPALTTGTCHGSGAVGGSSGGTFVAPACTAGTIILSSMPATPHGWICHADDLTTPADALTPKSSTTTSYTFNPVTTVASDVIQFYCNGY